MLIRLDLLLRSEALFALLISLFCYSGLHGSWLLFVVFLLVPDLSLLGYLVKGNGRLAAALYNGVHTYVLPLAAGLIAWKLRSVLCERLAVIWIAHIALDQLLGFGLKYPQGFKPTHIQSVSFYRS
jgi:hypothetical protein